jgi:hypothetical protein
MASPVGHVLAGLVIHVTTARDGNELLSKGRAALLTGVTLFPDLDLVANLLNGINHHQKESHSLGAAVIVALTCFLVGLARRWPGPGRLALIIGGVWAAHVVLDVLGGDTNPPFGPMALWPFSHAHFHFPYPIFLEVRRALAWDPMRHNIVAGAWDAILLAPILVWVWLRKRRSFAPATYA